MGWILRVFCAREVTDLLPVFKCLVLPHLEHASQLWFPSDMASIRNLESVQRTFTSRLTAMNQYNYWQRLEKLFLYSVERRERYIIIYIYIWKMIQDIILSVRSLHAEEFVVVHSARRGRLIRVNTVETYYSEAQQEAGSILYDKGPTVF